MEFDLKMFGEDYICEAKIFDKNYIITKQDNENYRLIESTHTVFRYKSNLFNIDIDSSIKIKN